MSRTCRDCGSAGHWPVVDPTGTMLGYFCDDCDRKDRRRRMGWRRRAKAQLKRLFQI
jgi:hypothetical protein